MRTASAASNVSFASKKRAQLAPLDELHDQVGDVAFLGEVVHLHDVRVVQPPDGLRLARELRGIAARRLVVDAAFFRIVLTATRRLSAGSRPS